MVKGPTKKFKKTLKNWKT